MSCCPSCSKGFKDDVSIAMHMSQPTSGCNTWVNSLVRLQQELNAPVPATQDHRTPPSPSQLTTNVLDLPAAEPSHSDLDAMHVNAANEPDVLTEEHFIGAAQIFGKGMSFVDKFNTDRFSAHRQENLYYLFASLQEWIGTVMGEPMDV